MQFGHGSFPDGLDTAKKAVTDMRATIQKEDSEPLSEEATETHPAPAEAHK
ncbi:MAG: hypothetical protein Q7U88_10020 [Desulfocapsaceae bacterium]|nr:hypothetical protein [Desulfocapsaceae bacterium]